MTNSDDAARVLYEAGVRYVVQQEALASVVVRKVRLYFSVSRVAASSCSSKCA